MTVQIETATQVEDAALAIEQKADAVTNLTYSAPDETGQAQLFGAAQADANNQEVPVVGRNEPCPCGSGKKYKQCHGKLA